MPWETQWENTDIALLCNFDAMQRVDGHRHTLAALFAGKNLGTCYRGGWMGPGVGLEGYAEEKISWPHWGSNPESSGPQ
jgi:hypothetical protein